MKTQISPEGLALAGFSLLTGNCLALIPFSDNFNSTKLDKEQWLPGIFGTGAKLKQSGGRLNFTMPVARAEEVDVWLELTNRAGFNESWQAIIDVVNTNNHRGNSSPGLWISNGDDPSDVVYLEFFGKGPKGGFGASFVLDGQYSVGPAIVVNPGVSKGSIRVSFNKTTKILSFWYDKTGSADGYQWTKLGTFATNGVGGDRRGDWLMNNESSTFTLKLAGYVEGKIVAPGTENLDNFILKGLK